MNKKSSKRSLRAVSLCIALSVGGLFLGFFSTQKVMAVTKSRFEKLELFNKVLFLVESQYYRDVDTDKLIQGAIKGMMSTLDPHSAFLDKNVFAKMQEETKGEFGGLGLEVTAQDGSLIVVTPIEDSPAFKAGMMPGDRIVEINNESTIGSTLEEAVNRMRGKNGDKITIGVVRENYEGIKTFVLTRQIIKITPVKHSVVRKNYAYIRLKQFQKRSAEEIINAIKKSRKITEKNGGLKGIVLDLRSNPGGLLDEAVDVSSIFLKDGVVVSTEGRDPKNKEIRYVKKSGYKEVDVPLVVLINSSSASASEIVAGAIQDWNRGIIMGSQSFGKGSVQTVAKIDDEKGVKLTIAQYMTPKGRKIQAIGIIPDVQVDEAEGSWVAAHRKEQRFIRESDLKNHLTATIETSQEKKERLALEKADREKRRARLKKLKADKKKKSEKPEYDWFVKYDAKEDYQVIQAINYIRSFDLFKKMNK
ncbi:S41 family peptidase [Halobacteriovorax sp. HLS]|uniref:S41 family peptidase n=1 Tax=Halobacteriovorax sp. HLS TaxID=2234000 RepID=UPI000FDBD915|nr:S41 family peptidase [Halobacteriovorax sp. HLS]